ncbi:hypothetical protein Dimus_021536 [Dionaea muscipula]
MIDDHQIINLLLEASADTRLWLGGVRNKGVMEIVELGLIEGNFRVFCIMVDLHRLDVGGGNLAMRALQFGVPALNEAGSIGQPGLSAAPVGGGGVNLGRDFLRRVLLWLRLPCHGDCLIDSLSYWG